MTRWLALLAFATTLAACGSSQSLTATLTPAPLPFNQEWPLFVRSRFRATYDVHVSDSTKADTWHVTWYRDGTTRQRFDLSGLRRNDGTRANLMLFAEGDQLIVCSADKKPGCDGGSNAVEVGTFALLAAGFGYELLGVDANITAPEPQPTTVAGVDAWCYSAHDATPAPNPDNTPKVDYCFSSSGVVVMRRESDPKGTSTTLVLTGDVSTPTDSDFQLPYALIPTPTP